MAGIVKNDAQSVALRARLAERVQLAQQDRLRSETRA